MKKMLALLLIVCFFQPAMALGSSDSSHFAFSYCQKLAAEKAVRSETCGQLDAEITKGEFIKILLSVSNIGEFSNAQSVAMDITDDFVRDAVNTAYEEGILSGENGDPTLSGAMNTLNRATAVTIGGRIYDVVDEFPASSTLTDLKDGAWYSTYAKKAVSAAVIVGKLRGGRRLFAADETLTFGEAMALAYQFLRAELAFDIWRDAGNAGTPSIAGIKLIDPLSTEYDIPVDIQDDIQAHTSEVISDELSLRSIPFDQTNIPAGANNILFGQYEVSGEEIIKEVTLKREGPGVETDFDQVYLFYGEGSGLNVIPSRVTSGKSIDSNTQEVQFFVNLPLNGKGLLEIRASLSLNASASSQHRFLITRIVTNKKTYEYGPDDPLNDAKLSTFSQSKIGTVMMRNNASLGNIFPGTRRTITRWEFQLDAAEAAFFKSITLKVSGVNASDMENYSLFETTGDRFLSFQQIANSFDSLVTFQVCEDPNASVCKPLLMKSGDTRIFHIQADLTGVRQRQEIAISLDEPVDAVLVGVSSGVGLHVVSDDFATRIN
ncbi:MAG: hypothetical protein P1V18_04270 [Candidatus Gracilibacteria bacterium]|nr:hypothetical protein [Candidatus Gracilibacteria bacterium]